jgi:RNA polymerase sigma-70 factor (ECF subfamily)
MAADPVNDALELPLATLALTGTGTGTSAVQLEATGSHPDRLEEEVVRLFDELRAPLLRYQLSLGLPVADAEEIVQEVFLSLYQHLRQGKSRSNLRAWTFTVAHNLALKSRNRTQRSSSVVDEDAIDQSPGPEERLADLQRQTRLQAVVRALSEPDQICLSLRAEGLRYREIAGILGISLGSVANSLERSLARLARADAGGSFSGGSGAARD